MNTLEFIEDHSLAGKTCLVTGASCQIGFQIALGLARKGAFIVLASHTDDNLTGNRRINP